LGKRLGRPYLQVELEGTPCNPLAQDTEEYGSYRSRLMANMGLSPLYSYENGKNKIVFKLKKQKNTPLLSLALTVAAAVTFGLAGLLLPEAWRTSVLDRLLSPLYKTFFNMLGTIVGPMVFLSVAWGICGIGDTATFGRIGKLMLFHFFKIFLSSVFWPVCWRFHSFLCTLCSRPAAEGSWTVCCKWFWTLFPRISLHHSSPETLCRSFCWLWLSAVRC